MKTIHRLKSMLLAGAMLAFTGPSFGAPFFPASASFNEGYSATKFADTNREVYWVLHNTVPMFTIDITRTSGWQILNDPFIQSISDDGSVWLVWARGTPGNPWDIAFWRIVNGALVGAGTYTFSGWDPYPGGGPIGDSYAQAFYGSGFDRLAFWVINPACQIQATMAWNLVGTGWWSIGFLDFAEDAETITVQFFNFDQRLATQYLMDKNGNWLAASTLPY